jgi:hypothetical protein
VHTDDNKWEYESDELKYFMRYTLKHLWGQGRLNLLSLLATTGSIDEYAAISEIKFVRGH